MTQPIDLAQAASAYRDGDLDAAAWQAVADRFGQAEAAAALAREDRLRVAVASLERPAMPAALHKQLAQLATRAAAAPGPLPGPGSAAGPAPWRWPLWGSFAVAACLLVALVPLLLRTDMGGAAGTAKPADGVAMQAQPAAPAYDRLGQKEADGDDGLRQRDAEKLNEAPSAPTTVAPVDQSPEGDFTSKGRAEAPGKDASKEVASLVPHDAAPPEYRNQRGVGGTTDREENAAKRMVATAGDSGAAAPAAPAAPGPAVMPAMPPAMPVATAPPAAPTRFRAPGAAAPGQGQLADEAARYKPMAAEGRAEEAKALTAAAKPAPVATPPAAVAPLPSDTANQTPAMEAGGGAPAAGAAMAPSADVADARAQTGGVVLEVRQLAAVLRKDVHSPATSDGVKAAEKEELKAERDLTLVPLRLTLRNQTAAALRLDAANLRWFALAADGSSLGSGLLTNVPAQIDAQGAWSWDLQLPQNTVSVRLPLDAQGNHVLARLEQAAPAQARGDAQFASEPAPPAAAAPAAPAAPPPPAP